MGENLKKLRYICIGLIFIFCMIFIPRDVVFAEDDGYYIKNMNVDVNVLDNRQYVIKETIDVYFNEERHGIIRDIPKAGSLESYSIDNISVDGAPYTINDGSNISIKIGDEDETIEGDQRYVIKYTLTHYADYEDDGDYLYLNLLGTEWDTRIEHFEAKVNLFDDAEIQDIQLNSGAYGNKGKGKFDLFNTNEKIYVESNQTILPYEGVTIDVKFPEGSFKNAPTYVYPYTIKDENVKIDITDAKEYFVSRSISLIKNTEDYAKISLWNSNSDKNVLITNQKVDNNNFIIGDTYLTLPRETGEYTINFSYKVRPTLSSHIKFIFGSYYDESEHENLDIIINSPFEINGYNIMLENKGKVLEKSKYSSEISNGKTITFSTEEKLVRRGNVQIELDIPSNLFFRPTPISTIIFTVLSVVMVIITFIVYLLFGKEKIIAPAVEFYPPKGYSSAEVGYIVNQKCNDSDITSLLFYWASLGYLKIDSFKNNKFTLYKTKELGEGHKEYEVKLFNKIFSLGKNNAVTNSKLKGKLYDEIQLTKGRIKNLYKGKYSLISNSSIIASIIIFIISIIPIIFLGSVAFSSINYESIVGALTTVVVVLSILLILYLLFRAAIKNKYKNGLSGLFITALVLSIFLYSSIFILAKAFAEVNSLCTIIMILSSFIILILSVFSNRRSEYGRVMLEQVLGFKRFMEIAEKERLEMLLEENPDYFYNTLPFAQVLGVTKKWTDKFKDITLENPSWYHNANNYYGYAMIDSLTRDMSYISKEATYVPPSDNSGSGSGGFSGGGFSGGGSGGGGGSSW